MIVPAGQPTDRELRLLAAFDYEPTARDIEVARLARETFAEIDAEIAAVGLQEFRRRNALLGQPRPGKV